MACSLAPAEEGTDDAKCTVPCSHLHNLGYKSTSWPLLSSYAQSGCWCLLPQNIMTELYEAADLVALEKEQARTG